MKAILFIALIGASLCFLEKDDTTPFVTPEQVLFHSSHASFETYSYEEHPFKNWTVGEVKRMLGARLMPLDNITLDDEKVQGLPEAFDARQQWPDCIHAIRNQGKCGSCWAFSASEVLSDRFCIASEGKVDVVLSPEDMVECDYLDHGCMGGNPLFSWLYLQWFGIVTDQCKPYTSMEGRKDSCKLFSKSCRADGVEYKKYHAGAFPTMFAGNTDKMKQSILEYGPIETGFMVYEDFMTYKGGVYKHTTGSFLGGHAVKIVGWGKEGTEEHWIVANSWGPNWGENGFFKIKFGECGFEAQAIASTPKL